MRVTIVAIGTRGDVQPAVALGVGLQAVGHTVRIATHRVYERLVAERGLGFSAVADDPTAEAKDGHWRTRRHRYDNGLIYARGVRETAGRVMRQRLLDCWRACQDADVILVSPLGFLVGYHVAERLEVPLIRTFHGPLTPTSHYPAFFIPRLLGFSPQINRWSHYASYQALWLLFRRLTNVARREVLQLPPLSIREPFTDPDRQQLPLLYSYSQVVAPMPADWGRWIHVTGFWFLDRSADWQPPADLVEFLAAGPAPVYVGFGSLSAFIPAETIRLVVEALRRAGQRGIVLGSVDAGARISTSGDVYVTDGIPHDWLFPQMAAVVHHGGAGTTAAGLRAGVPAVIVPTMPDGWLWARQVHELGVGLPPIPRHRLTVERLATAIRAAVGEPGMRERAAVIGGRLRAEDGVARAVELVNDYLGVGAGCERRQSAQVS